MSERQSNIELLRCIAIFMIIAVHADYWLLGQPNHNDFTENPIGTFWRVFWECVTIIGTNVFVLISGWFSIRPKLKSFLSFIFQIEFFILGIFLIGVVTGLTQFSLKSLSVCFLFFSPNWFIKSYIALYICAPILNAFIEKVHKKQLLLTIILFYTFQTIYGLSNAARFIEQGYSAFSFFGLYLVGRYLHLYGGFEIAKYGLWLLIGTILFNTVISLCGIFYGLPQITALIVSYVNPFVILGAIALLLLFTKWNIGSNRIINKIGKSTFAVYLFPMWFIFDYIYFNLIDNIYHNTSGIICFLLILSVLLITFICSIIVDQLRIFVWDCILRWIPQRYNKKLEY